MKFDPCDSFDLVHVVPFRSSRPELATRARRCDRGFPNCLQTLRMPLSFPTPPGCLHSAKKHIEVAAERIDLVSTAPDSALKFSTDISTALGASCFVITTAPP